MIHFRDSQSQLMQQVSSELSTLPTHQAPGLAQRIATGLVATWRESCQRAHSWLLAKYSPVRLVFDYIISPLLQRRVESATQNTFRHLGEVLEHRTERTLSDRSNPFLAKIDSFDDLGIDSTAELYFANRREDQTVPRNYQEFVHSLPTDARVETMAELFGPECAFIEPYREGAQASKTPHRQTSRGCDCGTAGRNRPCQKKTNGRTTDPHSNGLPSTS